jgi:hypothetical protein
MERLNASVLVERKQLAETLEITQKVHKGTNDKAGAPYVRHPILCGVAPDRPLYC